MDFELTDDQRHLAGRRHSASAGTQLVEGLDLEGSR